VLAPWQTFRLWRQMALWWANDLGPFDGGLPALRG
jgi:hypothetical protein